MEFKLNELIAYTDWERAQWRSWFEERGSAPLEVATGGERMRNVADLIQHIFAAEKRYIERLTGTSLTPYSQIPKDSARSLFDFGYESRAALKDFVRSVRDWNQQFELGIVDFRVKASMRKFLAHVLVHEIRHWAQIALLLRLAGYEDLGDHDLINSDAFV